MADFIINNNQTNLENLIVLGMPNKKPEFLIFSKQDEVDLLDFPIQKDLVDVALNYHGGHIPLDMEPKYEDCNNLEYELVKTELISNQINKGIFIKDSTTPLTGSDWLWREEYSTPLGLYQENNGVLDNYQFKKITNNQIQIKIFDDNIVPFNNDFLFIQRFFPGDFTLENPLSSNINVGEFTDDINNLPIYQSEYWIFKISNKFQDVLDSTLWTITLDKDINVIPSQFYTFVLLNRIESSGNLKELFLNTWQKIEIKTKQLLGDQYNYLGSLEPQGQKNYLHYENSGYLGVQNLLNKLNNNDGVNDDFILLDFEDNIKDHLYYEDDSININLPGLLINDLDGVLVIKNKNYILNNNIGYYGYLYYTNNNNENKNIGYVFYDLRIMVITDLELVCSMSYNSNRNYTLPKPITKNINLIQDTVTVDFQTILQPYTHFYTYRLKGGHYNTLPYNELTSFNWKQTQINDDPNNFTLEFLIPEIYHLKDFYNNTGIEQLEIEIIIGKWIIDNSNPLAPKITGWENVVIMPQLNLQLDNEPFNLLDNLGIKKINYEISFFQSQYNDAITNNLFYDLTQFWGVNTPNNLYCCECPWLIGTISYKNYINQYKMKVDYRLVSDKWNGTTNETFNCDNNFQGGKLITEMALKFANDEKPMIYAKISPPIIKTNNKDLFVRFNLDF